MRTVAGTEPATVIASLTDGDATQVGANAQHDEPLGVLDAVGILLGVAQGRDLHLVGLVDLIGSAVADEDGLAAPLDNDLL